MQRTYELMFIVRPDMADEEMDKLISTLESNVAASGGTVKSTDKMGKRRLAYLVRGFQEGNYVLITLEGTGAAIQERERRLAYLVRGFQEGNYVLITLEGTGAAIHELERRLRVTEPVIKFLTVRVDEENKRIGKIKAIRATRVKRAPAPAETAAASGESTPAAV